MLPNEVTDRQSFVKFIESLNKDFNNKEGYWDKVNIGDFLEAIANYSADIQGYYDNTNQQINADNPSWRVFADILKGASMYE